MGWLANLFNSKSVKESVAPDKAQALRKLQENVQNYPDFFSSLMDRYYSGGEWWSPVGAMPMLGGTSNKVHGKDTYGGFYTEQDLRFQRDACRLLFAREPVAKAIEGHLNAFVIGKGFSYKICPKKDFEDEYATPEAKKRLSQYQQQIDDWMDAQKWPEREQECYTCKVVDGEFFLWVKVYKGEINIRRLEPEHIQNKPGATFQDGWYLGVKYDLRDIETPIAYGYKPDYVEWQEIPADQIIHYKANVTRNVARGISDLYPITDDLNSIAQLSDNLRAGAAARAEIAYMWSVKNATPAAISGFADEQQDRSSTNPVTGKTNRYKGSRAGKAVAHGDNVEFTTMPQGDVEGSVSALQASLRVVGNRFGMPEYMISGDASNANYASTQMAGTPFVRKVEIEQNLLKRPFKQIFDMVMKQAAVKEIIPTSELVKLDIEIECTSPVIEDEYQQAQMYDIMRRNGVISPQKWCQNKGLDYEEVQRDINEWNEANMQAPDLGQAAGTTAFGAQQADKERDAQPVKEGFDPNEPRDEDGKWTALPHGAHFKPHKGMVGLFIPGKKTPIHVGDDEADIRSLLDRVQSGGKTGIDAAVEYEVAKVAARPSKGNDEATELGYKHGDRVKKSVLGVGGTMFTVSGTVTQTKSGHHVEMDAKSSGSNPAFGVNVKQGQRAKLDSSWVLAHEYDKQKADATK